MAPIHHGGNAERTLLSIGLRDVHASDRQRLPGRARAMHAHRHGRPLRRRQRDLAIDSGGPAPRVALGDLADTDQRVRPGPRIIFCRDRANAQSCSRVALKILRRSLATFCSWARQSTASQSKTSSGPFTVTVSNLSLGSPHSRRRCSKAHLPTSAPFRARPSGRHPAGSLPRPHGATATRDRSRCLSATGIRFLGILTRRGVPPLTIGLPGRQAWTPTGFPRSAHTRHGRGGRPLNPGARGVHTTIGASPWSPRAASTSGQALSPGPASVAPGLHDDEASSRVHSRSPVRPSPRPVAPRTERGPLGFSPRAPPPNGQDPRAHVKVGTDLEH